MKNVGNEANNRCENVTMIMNRFNSVFETKMF